MNKVSKGFVCGAGICLLSLFTLVGCSETTVTVVQPKITITMMAVQTQNTSSNSTGGAMSVGIPASGLSTDVVIQVFPVEKVNYTTAELGYQLISLGYYPSATALDILVSTKADISSPTDINIATGTVFADPSPVYLAASGLTSGTNYYYQALVTVSTGQVYPSNVESFTTSNH